MALPTTPTPSSQRDISWGAALVHGSPPSRLLTPSPLASHPVCFRRQSTIASNNQPSSAAAAAATTTTTTSTRDTRRRSLTMNRLTQVTYGSKMSNPHRRSSSFGGAGNYDSDDGNDDSFFVRAQDIKKVPKPSPGWEDFSALREFLTTTQPPSSSFMPSPHDSTATSTSPSFSTFLNASSSAYASQPRGPGASETDTAATASKTSSRTSFGGRWSMLRRVGRKSQVKVPKPLVLPDSAISGITSAGHRHIAISIPDEAAPFAKSPESEYIHFESNPGISALPHMEPRRESVKIRKSLIDMTAEDGVVTTVLRSQPPLAKSKRAPRSVILTQNQRGHHARQYSQGRIPNNAGMMGSGRPYQHAGMPARNSSVLATQGPLGIHGQSFPQHNEFDRKPLPWAAPRGMGGVGAEAPSAPLNMGMRHQPTPINEECVPPKHPGRETHARARIDPMPMSTANLSALAQFQFKPISREILPARPPSRESLNGRRDKVRDKKRRDMEALRSSRFRLAEDRTSQASEGVSLSISSSLSSRSLSSSTTASKRPKPQLAVCPIQVVVDVEPQPGASPKPPTFHLETLERLIGAQRQGPPRQESVSDASIDECFSPKSKAQTPMTSASSSPVQKKLTSRHKTHNRHSRREEARDLEEMETHTDIQIQKLYDVLQESRMREAERRIRRLERNRDVWLRALIPLLDDMNSAIKGSRSDKHKSKRQSKSKRSTKMRTAESSSEEDDAPRKPSKRTLLKERLMAKLAELERLEEREVQQSFEEEEDDADEEEEEEEEDDESDEERERGWREAIMGLEKTGMTALEPMMRELAGEMLAREQAKARSRR